MNAGGAGPAGRRGGRGEAVSIEIAVHGGGYVGLTAAIHDARAGKVAMICDPDPSVVDAINRGTPKASEILGDVSTGCAGERLGATTRFECVQDAPAHVVCVPSEKDGAPWMDLATQVVRRIAASDGASHQRDQLAVDARITLAAIRADFSRHPPETGPGDPASHGPVVTRGAIPGAVVFIRGSLCSSWR